MTKNPGPLADRDERSERALPEPTPDVCWVVVEEGFRLEREHELESLLAVGNGYLGVRGSLAEGSPLSRPATFLAGVFVPSAAPPRVPELLRLPDWGALRAELDGHVLAHDAGDLTHRRILDMRQGILFREWRHRDRAGRVAVVRGFRLASMAERHLLLQSVSLLPENFGGTLRVTATFVATPAGTPGPSGIASFRFEAADVVVAMACHTRLEIGGGPLPGRTSPEPPGSFSQTWEIPLEIGREVRLDRIVAVRTSRHDADPVHAAEDDVANAIRRSPEACVAAHVEQWRHRWESADVKVEGDPASQRALRFAAYHLISAADPADPTVSIGARTLSGEGYKGHVFWDTEVFIVPFFTWTWPDAARSLLLYRHHTLPAARERAAKLGFRGALYAWESAADGHDVTPRFAWTPQGDVLPVRSGEQEHHISADIAWGVWNYWRVTGDDDFLRDAGAEILLETARFWASRVTPGGDGLLHILRAMGPDEYHEDVDDSAYTNGMAAWNLRRAAETVALLRERWPDRWRALSRALSLGESAADDWRGIADRLYRGFDPATGLFEQFKGFFDLERIDLRTLDPRTAPVDVLLGHERVAHSQVLKQADVLMLIWLLWDEIPAEARDANFLYYEPRTAHGSSLSPPVHAAIAARLRRRDLAMRYFRQTAEIDLADNMGNAAGGVHAAALAGLWQAAVFGFAGLGLASDEPTLAPALPPAWKSLAFRTRWRGEVRIFRARPEET